MGSWVCGWVDVLIWEWVLLRKVFLGGGLWIDFVGLWVMVVVGWLVAMGFVVGFVMDLHGLF